MSQKLLLIWGWSPGYLNLSIIAHNCVSKSIWPVGFILSGLVELAQQAVARNQSILIGALTLLSLDLKTFRNAYFINNNWVAAQISIIDHDEPLTPTFLVGPFTGGAPANPLPSLRSGPYGEPEALIASYEVEVHWLGLITVRCGATPSMTIIEGEMNQGFVRLPHSLVRWR
jgi:hypothetical protein